MQQKALYRVLVPLTFNDGSAVDQSVLDQIEDDFFIAFGGCTVGGTVRGCYRMDDGSKQVDHLLQIWVAVADEDKPELDAIVAKHCKVLRQESMYLEKTGGTVEFVRASK